LRKKASGLEVDFYSL